MVIVVMAIVMAMATVMATEATAIMVLGILQVMAMVIPLNKALI